jgi:hypothetical protein
MRWLPRSASKKGRDIPAGAACLPRLHLSLRFSLPFCHAIQQHTRMIRLWILLAWVLSFSVQAEPQSVARVHHFVYFGRDRELLPTHPFLNINSFEGAQIAYAWKQLEHGMDGYEFADIDADLQVLKAHGMKLWIQLQDATFMPNNQAVPAYLMKRKEFNGGANPQYNDAGKVEGWVARRWDPAVQARFQKLFVALGKRYDGVIAGINLQETAIGIAEDGPSKAPEFTYVGYRDAIKQNMLALKQSFPKSIVMQYVNFMPGESLPESDQGFIKSLFDYGEKIEVAIGAPDLLPKRLFQQANAYKLMKEKKKAGKLTIGIAVQDGNYRAETGDTTPPKAGDQWPDVVPELAEYADKTLGATYVFWSIQEPYFTKNVIPHFSKVR